MKTVHLESSRVQSIHFEGQMSVKKKNYSKSPNSINFRNNDILIDDIWLDSLGIRMYTLLVSKVHKSEFYECENDCVLFQYKIVIRINHISMATLQL